MDSKFKIGEQVICRYLPGAPLVTFEGYCMSRFCYINHSSLGEGNFIVPVDSIERPEDYYKHPETTHFIPQFSADSKDTNPKDAIGSTKLPFHLVPDSLKVYAALAFCEGATKYGAFNWRIAGVRASIYKSALERHLAKWWNGEECDPVTGVPHLASVIACAGIILDARLVDKLTDDRPPRAPMAKLIDDAASSVQHLQKLHEDKHPRHWTIDDGEPE